MVRKNKGKEFSQQTIQETILGLWLKLNKYKLIYSIFYRSFSIDVLF